MIRIMCYRYPPSFLLFFCLSIVHSLAKPHPEAASRAETGHFIDDPERHDVQYDHDAFLGKEAAQEFSTLTADESKAKLGTILTKIDTNGDRIITEDEMKVWITYVAQSTTQKDVTKHWEQVNPSNDSHIGWTQYIEVTYGPEQERLQDTENAATYQRLVNHDKKRWKAADVDGDDQLTLEEYIAFLHPEEKPHMRQVLIDELLDSVDTDRDGYVSEVEYLNDLARAYQTPLIPGEPQPDWLERERGQFKTYRDTNGDGQMDRAEVGEWIMPANYDAVEAETKHLFYHADANKDGVLSEEEILEKFDLFVGSQATDYGNALNDRDEL